MLKGEKVFLRALEESDLDLLYEWESLPEICKISGTVEPLSKSVLLRFIQSITNLKTDGQLRLMICDIDNNRIGTVDVFEYDQQNLRAGIGIVIADVEARQKGFAFEALELVIDYCKEVLHLKQLFANVLADNEISLTLFDKLRFEKIGNKKYWIRDGDQWKDEWLLQRIIR